MGFENSKQHGSPHHFLTQLAGAWNGTCLTWLDPVEAPHESRIQASIQLILEGRFALVLYQSILEGEPQHGMFTFGFNTISNRYEASWVDSHHNNTAIMFCVGEGRENGFFVLGHYADPSGGPEWGWRTEVELADPGHLRIAAHTIDPEGEEARAVEMILTRVK
jgi:hypothetical protein